MTIRARWRLRTQIASRPFLPAEWLRCSSHIYLQIDAWKSIDYQYRDRSISALTATRRAGGLILPTGYH